MPRVVSKQEVSDRRASAAPAGARGGEDTTDVVRAPKKTVRSEGGAAEDAVLNDRDVLVDDVDLKLPLPFKKRCAHRLCKFCECCCVLTCVGVASWVLYVFYAADGGTRRLLRGETYSWEKLD